MDNYEWANQYPDVQKVCKLFDLNFLSNPLRHSYNALNSILQDGPQCGLVALAMLTEHATKNNVDKLMKRAEALNFTYNGEIFSAADMCTLAKEYLNDKKVELYTGNLSSDEIKEFLLSGGYALVPYPSIPFLSKIFTF